MSRFLSPRLPAAVAALVLLALPLFAGAADAEPAGPQLLRECEAAQSLRLATLEGERGGDAVALNAGLCLGLLQTLSEVNELLSKPLFCPPSGAPLAEALRVVVEDLRRNPDRKNDSRTAIALGALKAAWPCRS